LDFAVGGAIKPLAIKAPVSKVKSRIKILLLLLKLAISLLIQDLS
jgi:hypothetical protein